MTPWETLHPLAGIMQRREREVTIRKQEGCPSLQFSCHTVNYPSHTEWRPEKLPMTGWEAISRALIPTAYNL